MSIFPFFVTGIVREGEFGKLRTVPRPRSGPFVSINPSYPSTTGAGGEDYKFPWVPTLVPACCIVGSTDWFQIGSVARIQTPNWSLFQMPVWGTKLNEALILERGARNGN